VEELDKLALAEVENIGPSQMVMLDFNFPSSSIETSLEFACHEPGHYEGGMRQDISVKS